MNADGETSVTMVLNVFSSTAVRRRRNSSLRAEMDQKEGRELMQEEDKVRRIGRNLDPTGRVTGNATLARDVTVNLSATSDTMMKKLGTSCTLSN